ncbi:MAG: lyase family protein, partial [Acidaminobacteraceae bacterium]
MKLWAGRFKESTSELLEKFNESISFDHRLYVEDIEGSVAHGKMLNKIGILSDTELVTLIYGLNEIKDEIASGDAKLTIKNEDIHMNVESLLVEKIGPLGKKLHTGRSRNDQVALDLRLFTMKKTKTALNLIKELLQVIVTLSEEQVEVIMPGYTHLQRAQPIRLSFHLMAYFEMLKRDH